MNVNGEEAVGRRVWEETTRLERMANRGEEAWHPRGLPRNRDGAHAFTHFYWGTMVDQENAFPHRRQKRVLGKMLAKVLIPVIYKNRVWCLEESLWPISFAEFVGLNEQLATKFPEIHSGRKWQAIINYYEQIRQELEALE